MKTNILIVEDDVSINSLLYEILTKNEYGVISAYSGSEAMMCIQKENFDLIILDLMIPGINGENLIKKIRIKFTMPIIVISAKPGQEVKIETLTLGADDFISKPFDINEVLARVNAQLRRYTKFSNNNYKTKLVFKNLVLDKENIKVTVNGNNICLTSIEYSILEILMSYPSKVFTKANLFSHVWKDDFMGDDNTVNVHISNIRSKISAYDNDNEYIHTVWGIGFKMSDKI